MQKKIYTLISLFIALCAFTSACNGNGHSHTFQDVWDKNATHHWKSATCKHVDIKDSFSTHTDSNEDGLCETCGYDVGHTHTFATTWTQDQTHHWKSATCSHTNEKSEYGLHTDDNADTNCDDCGMHVHTVNKAGICDTCGAQVIPMDEMNVEMVIAMARLNQNKIVSATVAHEFNSVTLHKHETAVYTFGNSATKIEKSTQSNPLNPSESTTSLETLWAYTDAEDTISPVKAIQERTVNGNATLSTVTLNPDDMRGYHFFIPTLVESYGAEELLAVLYEKSQDETAVSYTLTHNVNDNIYAFSFSNLIPHETTPYLLETQVEFTYDDNYVLTACYVQTQTSEQSANAIPYVYTWQVTQTAGERVYVHTKTLDDFKPTGFTFSHNGTTLTSGCSLHFTRGDDLLIRMACIPTTAYYSLVAEQVSVTLADANKKQLLIQIGLENNLPYIIANALIAGEYTLTFTYNQQILFTATIFVQSVCVTTTITAVNTYVDLVTFTAPQSGRYTFTIPAGYGAWDKQAYETDWNSFPHVDPTTQPFGGTFSVDLVAGAQYSFYLCAPMLGEVQIPYDFQAINLS